MIGKIEKKETVSVTYTLSDLAWLTKINTGKILDGYILDRGYPMHSNGFEITLNFVKE